MGRWREVEGHGELWGWDFGFGLGEQVMQEGDTILAEMSRGCDFLNYP